MAAESWKDTAYKDTKVRIGNPLNSKDATVKVVIFEPSNPEMAANIQKLSVDSYLDVPEQTTNIRGQSTQCPKEIVEISHNGSQQDN
ncbi:hypothetical protein JTB14_036131 [Gonioctena quinquepunctata]|nr:hypothetical protein JTB14_036131 [Gonioctena quinquepunctata]